MHQAIRPRTSRRSCGRDDERVVDSTEASVGERDHPTRDQQHAERPHDRDGDRAPTAVEPGAEPDHGHRSPVRREPLAQQRQLDSSRTTRENAASDVVFRQL